MSAVRAQTKAKVEWPVRYLRASSSAQRGQAYGRSWSSCSPVTTLCCR